MHMADCLEIEDRKVRSRMIGNLPVASGGMMKGDLQDDCSDRRRKHGGKD